MMSTPDQWSLVCDIGLVEEPGTQETLTKAYKSSKDLRDSKDLNDTRFFSLRRDHFAKLWQTFRTALPYTDPSHQPLPH